MKRSGMDRATEEVADGVMMEVTLGTNCVGRKLNAVAVLAQMGGVARAQLSKGPAMGTRKRGLRFVDLRRRGAEDGIGVERIDNVADGISVNLINGFFVVPLEHDAAIEERRNNAGVSRVDCVFHTSGTRRRRQRAVGDVGRAES